MIGKLYKEFNSLLAKKDYKDAENKMQEILQLPEQPWQQYLYMPATFYEDLGDYISPTKEAVTCYKKALLYRYEIGANATGSGEGMEAMYHIKRIQQKVKALAYS